MFICTSFVRFKTLLSIYYRVVNNYDEDGRTLSYFFLLRLRLGEKISNLIFILHVLEVKTF